MLRRGLSVSEAALPIQARFQSHTKTFGEHTLQIAPFPGRKKQPEQAQTELQGIYQYEYYVQAPRQQVLRGASRTR